MTPSLQNRFENPRTPPEGVNLPGFFWETLRCSLRAFWCWGWQGKVQGLAAVTAFPSFARKGQSQGHSHLFSDASRDNNAWSNSHIPCPQKIFVTQVLTGRRLSQDAKTHKFDERKKNHQASWSQACTATLNTEPVCSFPVSRILYLAGPRALTHQKIFISLQAPTLNI